jgi:hypothetical protein
MAFMKEFCGLDLGQDYINLVNDVSENGFVVVLKERRVGFSEFLKAYVIWRLIFGLNEDMLVLLPNGYERGLFSRDIGSVVDTIAHSGLVDRGDIRSYTDSIEIRSNRVFTRIAGKHSHRGFNPTLIVLDGFHRVNHARDIWTSMAPILSLESSEYIISSSMDKQASCFKDIWKSAIKGDSPFSPHYIG